MMRPRGITSCRRSWRMRGLWPVRLGSRCGGWCSGVKWSQRKHWMPEGDTLFRAAATLQRAIGGQVVTRFESVLPKLERVDVDTPIAGRTVERIESAGKWLLIRFSGGLTLLTHMLMSGSWHIYR